jgi:hypothetical protein
MILNQINKIVSVTILWLIFSLANAASFELIVSEQQLAANQNITLSFRLTDAKAKNQPDFSPLTQYFEIYHQGANSSYSIINGQVSQSVGWELIVAPKVTGVITIPSINVLTNKGVLASNTVQLEVLNGASSSTVAAPTTQIQSVGEVWLKGYFESKEFFVNQPFVYTLKVFSKVAFADLALNDIYADDAVVERHDDKTQYTQVVNGQQVNVIEVKYLITPLHAGKVILNPASLRYQKIAAFFGRQPAPITVYSDEEVIHALAASNLQPFSKLTLDDAWDNSNNQVHENDSLTRTIKIVGTDGYADALKINLPSQSAQYHVYEDKPKDSKTITQDNRVVSTKIINYTIIPTKAGELLIPKISIKWFNTTTKKIDSLELAEKRLVVLPSANTQGVASDNLVENQSAVTASNSSSAAYKLAFFISVILNVVLMAVILGRNFWQQQKAKIVPMALEDVTTINGLKDYINFVARTKWKIKINLPLKDLLVALANNYTYDQDLAKELISKLNSNLYFKEELQLSKALELWHKFIATVAKKHLAKSSTYSTKLNPV